MTRVRPVLQSPLASVCLYNWAVRHLSCVLSSGSLPDLSWPPPELLREGEGTGLVLPDTGWNSTERLLRLQQVRSRTLTLTQTLTQTELESVSVSVTVTDTDTDSNTDTDGAGDAVDTLEHSGQTAD